MHHNADFDELVFYFRGPGAYGALTDPGQLVWVPKSVTHWGPIEDVPRGIPRLAHRKHRNFRLTPAGKDAAQPMETGQFGICDIPTSSPA
jgi:homogentisate 1,2-dioxygenase